MGQRFTPAQRALIYASTGGQCVRCHHPITGRWDVDHILPRVMGGSSAYANLGPAHRWCNRSMGNALRYQGRSRFRNVADLPRARRVFFGGGSATAVGNKNSAQIAQVRK